MVINVKKLVSGCDTNDQGNVIYRYVALNLRESKPVSLDFSGVSNVTSSFVNSSFVQLVDDFGYDTVRTLLALKSVNSQIGNMLKDRMTKIAA
jgi:hypothetical protein